MSGRHRKPTHTARNLAALSASGAFAVVPALANNGTAEAVTPTAMETTDTFPTVDWAPIIACESGGNPAAQNRSSTASGLFQFLDSSWAAYGGLRFGRRAKDASPAEQQEIADRAFAQSGLSPWDASKGCWGGKVNTAAHSAPRGPSRPRSHTVPHPAPAAGGGYTVAAGDTLSTIAAGHGTTWEALYAANRGALTDPNRIFPGQRLTLPGGAPAPAPAGGGSAGPAKTLTVDVTGYSFADNQGGNNATISMPVIHKTAGGVGTFSDPITAASPGSAGSTEFPAGTKFYLPTIKRYVIVEDSGASKMDNPHLDIYVGGEGTSEKDPGGCESRITGTVQAELNPPPGRPVTAGPIFAGGSCHL